MRTRFLLALTAVALAAVRLSAHDFWLAAENWTPTGAAPVTITAGVGERFPTRTNFRNRENWLAEWRVIGASADVPVTKEFRRSDLVMATDVMLPSEGAYLGVAMVAAQTIEMKGQEFTDYLKEEGLENIIAARKTAGETDKTTKERYARYAKIAIRNGAGSGAHLTRPVGMRAEFVPSSDPTMVRAGGSLTVQLLANGTPVVGAAVSAVSGEKTVRAQTDPQGRATFTIDREGAWLVKTVHMVRLPDPTDAEWESYWVTLAFHTAGR
jgi:uncharacterized GH25 family protein